MARLASGTGGVSKVFKTSTTKKASILDILNTLGLEMGVTAGKASKVLKVFMVLVLGMLSTLLARRLSNGTPGGAAK